MTLVLMAAAAALAALGTEAAALLLVAAAIAAALGSTVVAASTWTAALAAGMVLLSRTRRRLALPIAGSAAVLASAAAPNAAAVLGLWTLGTLAFVFGSDVSGDAGARRWGALCLVADVPFVAAVIAGATHGLQAWPSGAGTFAAAALAVTGAAKVSLAAAPDASDEPGVLLAARTQGVVAVLLAAQAAPHLALQGLVIAGGVAFAVLPHVGVEAVVDVGQEVALVAVAAASAALGWGPRGWVWGTLAAGTLIHHLRLSTRRQSLASVAALLTRGGLIGLPFIPVVVAELEGAARVRPVAGAALVAAFVYGLAARMRPVARARLRRAPRLGELAPLAFGAAAFAASVWAPLLSSPRPPAGASIDWLPAWGALAIGGAAVVGGFFPGFVRGPGRVPRPARLELPALPVGDVLGRPRVLQALAVALVAGAGAMWVVGAIRGFL